MFTKTILSIVLLFLLWSCEKKRVAPAITSTSAYTGTLKVTVLDFYLNKGGQQTDSALSHTTVYLYNSSYNLVNADPASYSGITDSAGVVVFTGLTQTYYYILTSNTQFGKMNEYVETPPNAVALAQVNY